MSTCFAGRATLLCYNPWADRAPSPFLCYFLRPVSSSKMEHHHNREVSLPNQKRPNIVFVFADQLRASAVGCYGREQVQTPHLDAFAAQGTRLTRVFSNSPVCGPARATILTSLYALHHGVVFNDMQLRTDVRSIAHRLGGAGYRCGYVGKWHLDCIDRAVFVPPGPRRQGFDDYWASANCTHKYSKAYYYLNDNPEPVWIDGYEPEHQTDLAVGYLERAAARQKANANEPGNPFCLFLSWGPPHCPYGDVPGSYLDLYPEKSIQFLPNVPAEANPDRATIAGYYAHITALDECFGRLTAALDRLDLARDTIVVFTSDHGDMLYSQNRGWKCKPWQESANVPFLIRWPGHVPAGAVSDSPLGLVDVMPTLLGLAGLPAPTSPEIDGRDLSQCLLGRKPEPDGAVFLSMPIIPQKYSYPEWRGIATRTHTYARFRDRPWLLYDDVNDPYQLHNLVDDPAHLDLRHALEKRLEQFMTNAGDSFETTQTLADRLCLDHQGGVMPNYENESIKRGRAQHFAHQKTTSK